MTKKKFYAIIALCLSSIITFAYDAPVPNDVIINETTIDALSKLLNQYANAYPTSKLTCCPHTWYMEVTAYNFDKKDAECYVSTCGESNGATVEWLSYQNFPEPKWTMHLTLLHAPQRSSSEANYKCWEIGRDYGKAWQNKNRDEKMVPQLKYERNWVLDRYGESSIPYFDWGFVSSLSGWELTEKPLTLLPWEN